MMSDCEADLDDFPVENKDRPAVDGSTSWFEYEELVDR